MDHTDITTQRQILQMYAQYAISGNSTFIQDGESLLHQQIEKYNHTQDITGIARCGGMIAMLTEFRLIEGKADEILKDLDKFLFKAVYYREHTDLSHSCGLLCVGNYFLHRIRNNHISLASLANKTVLVSILDILLAYGSVNGYTYPISQPHLLSGTECTDVEIFLQALDSLHLCNELSDQLRLNIPLQQDSWQPIEIIRHASWKKDNETLKSGLLLVRSDKDDIPACELATLSLQHQELFPWWNFY